MKNNIENLIEELISLARNIENDEILLIDIYSLVLRIMEYSNESIPRSVQLSRYIICYEGIIQASVDEELITKLRMDLSSMLKEKKDGTYTTYVSDIGEKSDFVKR